MTQTTSVTGILEDSAGRPVSDALVMIIDGPHEFPEIASVSDERGLFVLSGVVVPGRYTVQVQGSSGAVKREVDLEKNNPVRIRL